MATFRLDHLVFVVRDLEASAASFEALLGRRRSWRGRHPLYGTVNLLYRLDTAYLELLARDPQSTVQSAWGDSVDAFLAAHGEGFFSVALGTPDGAAAVAELRARGIPAGEARAGEGVDLDTGAVR